MERTDELRIRISGDEKRGLKRKAKQKKMALTSYVRLKLELPQAQRGRPRKEVVL